MSTRSRIGYVDENNNYRSVYCHHDGYLEGVGYALLNFYNRSDLVGEIVSLGDLSSLGENLKPRGEDNPGGTFAYNRDRGEKTTASVTPMCGSKLYALMDSTWAEYIYMFRDGEWLVSHDCVVWAKLKDAIKLAEVIH